MKESHISKIFITGCSSGLGLAIARLFTDRNWDVVAGVRVPRDYRLPCSERIGIVQLDVTDPASVKSAVAAAGPIDALVNSAGIGLISAVEETPISIARQIFETNTLGPIAMAQSVLPQMREMGSGAIVNISSSVSFAPLPLMSIYAASKAAVNAWSESLASEVEPFGIRIRVVVPGRMPSTRFSENTRLRLESGITPPYALIADRILERLQSDSGPVTSEDEVAEAVWRAVVDDDAPLYLPVDRRTVAPSSVR